VSELPEHRGVADTAATASTIAEMRDTCPGSPHHGLPPLPLVSAAASVASSFRRAGPNLDYAQTM